jgi:hypothetical protein
MFIKSASLASVFLVGSTLILGGCGAEAPGASEDESVSDETVELGTTEQAVYIGWTAYTSEERAPIGCDGGSLPTQAQCSGSYCDNMRLNCQDSGAYRGGSYWTPYFSDNGIPVFRLCDPGYWMTGLACTGQYCDNLSLQCTYMSGISPKNCFWSGWHSEENTGLLNFGPGVYPTGAWCRGDYCDDIKYYLCQP